MYRTLLDLCRACEGVCLVNPADTTPEACSGTQSTERGTIQSALPRKTSKVNYRRSVPQTDSGG